MEDNKVENSGSRTPKTKNDFETIKINSGNVILISDIHFGVSSSSEEWQENINDYFQNWFIPYVKGELKKTPDAVICCLGDVYHDRKSIDIDVNNLCIDIFEQLAQIIPVYIINGNHDLSKKTNKGNSSLRSLGNIDNVTVIKEPTMLQFVEGRKNIAKVAAIPYLGDCNDENKELVKFDKRADYAFMHTDISKMKFDNGMTIVGAVDAEKFAGKVISGHIHKRQETDKVVYVGSPYQMSRGDIDNQKGIYKLVLSTGEMVFTPNDYSPIFQKIDITKFLNFTDKERMVTLKNNYTDIVIDEVNIDKYKMGDVYEILNSCQAKRAQIQVIKSKTNIQVDENSEEHTELSMEELINSAIEQLADVDDEFKGKLKVMSAEYLKNAQSELESA